MTLLDRVEKALDVAASWRRGQYEWDAVEMFLLDLGMYGISKSKHGRGPQTQAFLPRIIAYLNGVRFEL